MTQVREEVYFTKGRVIVRGKTVKRGEAKKADYLLYYKPNIPLAVIEAKDNNHSVGDGMPQALEYAEMLDIPFAYSSNGDAFLEHDRTVDLRHRHPRNPARPVPLPGGALDALPRRQGVSRRRRKQSPPRTTTTTAPARRPATTSSSAINRTVEAIARGEDRILLVMATGTGKTYTAFQIIWRLWKAGTKKRILFLVDRNILADQTKTNDFKPFGTAMTKITNRTVDKSFEIYLCLYQAVTGTEEEQNIYKQFSPDFFDLVFVDECHRGSAADDANWRKVLEYFTSATQIGLTATPQGNQGRLQHRVLRRARSTPTPCGRASRTASWPPTRSSASASTRTWTAGGRKLGQDGQVRPAIEDREYNDRDFDRNLILEKRTAAGRRQDHRVPQGDRPLRQDHHLLREHRPRRAHAPGHGQRQPRPGRRQQPVRHAHHRRQRRGQGPARQLHRSREDLSGHRLTTSR
jgi:type I restriction enzyme R subunit